MTPSQIHPGTFWRERHASRSGRRRMVQVLAVQDALCGYVEVRDEDTGRCYPMRWHSLVRRFEMQAETEAA